MTAGEAVGGVSTLGYARMYVAHGWPLLVCHPRTKDPLGELVPHAVHSATTNLERIASWLRKYPDANLGVACGAPGPQVLDLDYPDRAPAAVLVAARDPRVPKVRSHRTARSGHAYFAGTDAGTIDLGYGELRGHGSYTMVPPSIHPTGEAYVWLHEPRGRLPTVPKLVAADKTTLGAGEQPDVDTVAPGGMYDHLVDLAVRLARSGITDSGRIERILTVEFDAVRVTGADYGPAVAGRRDTRRIAQWVSGSKIADRQRAVADFVERWATPARNEQEAL
jgi:hypothetical protein